MKAKVIGAAAALLLTAGAAAAGSDTWKTAASGWFHTGTNWTDNTVPTASDTVGFDRAGTYQVWWDATTGTRATQSLLLSAGNVTFRPANGGLWTWMIHDPSSSADATIRGGTLTFGLAGYTGRFVVDIDDLLDVGGGGTLNVRLVSRVEASASQIGSTGVGTLGISSGGQLSTTSGILGYSSGSNGGVTVDGSDSTWTNSGFLYVGNGGVGTLAISNAGQVSNKDGYVGYAPGPTCNVTVDGEKSTWENHSSLYVGYSGPGTLAISAGGQVSNTAGYVGNNGGCTGGVTVDGAASAWTNTGLLYVGNSGAGTLAISAGGHVLNTTSYIGSKSGSTGGVTVDGAGSTWANTGDLLVGDYGTGTLAIRAGGQVTNTFGIVGNNIGSTGGVTVDGAGSTWANTWSLTVGDYGAGTLAISGGGKVSNSVGFIAYWPGATGGVTVDGGGSAWTNTSSLYVGNSGAGTLAISGGGKVSNSVGFVGSVSTGSVTVDGAGSAWTNANALYVGDYGTGTLAIRAGGLVNNTAGYVGYKSGSTGGVTVDGAGSTWANTGDLSVGEVGAGTLAIRSGGLVSNWRGYVGLDLGSTGGVTVDGAASAWTNTGLLYVGNSGAGTLAISGGGQVSNTTGFIAYWPGATGGVTVDGGGSAWTNSGALSVGEVGAGTLAIRAGGQVSNTTGYVGTNAGATGGVTVDGAGSTWTNTSSLYVGNSGAGTLAISDGGQVSNTTGYVGANAGATGGVTVDGAGSTWTNSGSLHLGGNGVQPGGAGSVFVGQGAEVGVGETLKLWPLGTLTLAGGTVRFHNPNPIVFGGGALNYYAGTVAFDCDVTVAAGLNQVTASILFGPAPVLPAGRGLAIGGKATLLTPVTLNGGTFSAGSLVNVSLLQFNSGTFNLTASDMTVGAGGLFGSSLALSSARAINVTQNVTIAPSALLDLQGGAFSAGAIVNQGQILLESPLGGLSGGALTNSGLVTGTGRIDNALSNLAAGQVRADSGQRLRFTGSGNANAGLIQAVGGEVEFTQGLTNAASSGLVAGENATFRFTGGLTNNGSVALSFGTSRILGDIANSTTGRITVSGGSNVTFYDDVANSGSITVSAGSTAVYFGSFSGNGVAGTGTNYFEGDLRPGHSPACIGFGGDVSFAPTARLEIELANPDNSDPAHPRFDALAVEGDVSLAGKLLLEWLPVPGDPSSRFGGVYDVLTYRGIRQCEFDAEIAGALVNYVKEIRYDVDLGGGLKGVQVELYDLLDGDADLNGMVGYSDLLALFSGSDKGWSSGDFNFDGAVSASDYILLKTSFGRSVPIRGGVFAPGSVPEPATLSLLALGGLAVIRRRRK